MNQQEPTQRHKDLSKMFGKMGDALYKEGMTNKDYVTASMGNIMIAMSSAVLSVQDTRLLGELCAMISARRVVKKLTNGEDVLGGKASESFEDLMRRLNQRKKDEEDGDKPESD